MLHLLFTLLIILIVIGVLVWVASALFGRTR